MISVFVFVFMFMFVFVFVFVILKGKIKNLKFFCLFFVCFWVFSCYFGPIEEYDPGVFVFRFLI